MRELKSLWITALIALSIVSVPVLSAEISGQIVDLNGRAVSNAMITLYPTYPGPTAITVYSNSDGAFVFPDQENLNDASEVDVGIRALGYELVESIFSESEENGVALNVIVRYTPNQAESAPASAWLGQAADHEAASTFVMDCIGCHQVPNTEFRHYSSAIAAIPGEDRAHILQEGWTSLVRYMNFLSAEEFGRGPDAAPPEASRVYDVGDGERVINFITRAWPDTMNSISGYEWGAPLAVTSETVITEYEVAGRNAVREALLLGEPASLWVADVATNRIFKIDPESGYTTSLEVPSETDMGPHSLHRGEDGSLWIAPFVSSVVAHLDVETETWRTWDMETIDGRTTGIHDLSFGSQHTLLSDQEGNVWFSDIANNSVGYLDPDNGDIEIYGAPLPESRQNGPASLYGLVMEDDRSHLWYSQLGGGAIGSFNIETREFEEMVTLPANAGPRRLSINEEGVLFVPLYGRGQLMEYDTQSRAVIGTYDLPDTASAPYATTWDPVRKVVWIPTSNADAIYRFDPIDKSFSVLPMPRTHALIRMVDVDPETGRLITSYGNIVERVQGPRMALIIEPGDGAYR